MSVRPSLLLPGNVGIAHAVDAARFALCEFLRMDANPNQLERWLFGPYREATRFGPRMKSSSGELKPAILEAQRKTARLIEQAGVGGDALVRVLPAVVHIRPAHDCFGGRGMIPFDEPGPLLDKTVALALADYLTRPDDFLAHDYATAASPLRRISSMVCKAAVGAEAERKTS